MKSSKIIIYDEPTVPEIQLKKAREYITDTFHIPVEIRKNFFETVDEEIFKKNAAIKVTDLKSKFTKYAPTPNDIRIEKENINMLGDKAMPLYDGYEMYDIISQAINTDDTLYIIFTNKLTVTFDDADFKYHARALVGANPAIISTSGMIEAAAKPREYYIDLMTDTSEDKITKTNKKYSGEFLEYHDLRLYDVSIGYLLQAIMYYETGEAFCDSKECRLYNAHWQKDLLYSQVTNKKICKRHLQIIESFVR